jgi:formate-dependent nitrite reductase membrane component NrfD
MKRNLEKSFVKRFFTFLLLACLQMQAFAQDTTYSTSTTTASEDLWYMQPWVWVVGGIVLLLLLIALFSGKSKNKNTSRTDKVIITKTVRTETDVDD